jgi:hypothetical protein
VPVALAFRGALWWLLGPRDASAGFGGLAMLVMAAAAAVFVVVLGSEVVGRVHPDPRG